MMIEFCKFEGFGNDYLVLSADDLHDVGTLGEFAIKICDRNFGAGGDGIAIWEKLDIEGADFSVRIINPDGSEADFSGNGTRCAVAYLYYDNIWREDSLKLATKSGIKNYRLIDESTPGHYWFMAEIGQPKFNTNDVPFTADGELTEAKDYPLETSVGPVLMTAVNIGNPVCVIFVDEFTDYDWRALGKEIETHTQFPARTNVVFVKPVDEENVEVRIWERGAGETSSSGTCSTAAAVAAAYTGRSGREVSVHAPGGTTEVTWRDDGELLLKGRADLVFSGEYNFTG